MKIQALSALLFLLIAANEAKVWDKCELGREMKSKGLDGFYGYPLGNWICMAFHESKYNSSAVSSSNTDGGVGFGIFQISSKYWCQYGKLYSENRCDKLCGSFLNDDISDDIECAKKMVNISQGMHVCALEDGELEDVCQAVDSPLTMSNGRQG
ncbi:lysozyme C, milk isozyme-like [Heteronotia binoei]|uniref:lysozyme C, milk isozyme-like n=1 Tax=Heteronotia binoei TaxID=13085 RepID=UPI0029302A02|nr:lysozyme C, milk isozyme-like [Heteronotia binoei]